MSRRHGTWYYWVFLALFGSVFWSLLAIVAQTAWGYGSTLAWGYAVPWFILMFWICAFLAVFPIGLVGELD